MKIAIIGNGPSREIFDRQDRSQYDVVIGCNFPHTQVDYSVMVDAYAAKYLRKGAEKHHMLGTFRLVLGERAIAMLEGIKEVPAGSRSMAQWLSQDGYLEDIIMYPAKFHGENDAQKFVSSGHAAFMWATEQWPDAELDMFGFDSLFIGSEKVSLTRKDLKGDYADTRYVQNKPTLCVEKWTEYWDELFYDQNFNKVVFWGYEGDGWFLPGNGERVGYRKVEKPVDET